VYRKALIFTLIVGVLALQWALWAGKSNIVDLIYLQQTLASLETKNASLRHRNDRLHADINEIKSRLEAIEFDFTGRNLLPDGAARRKCIEDPYRIKRGIFLIPVTLDHRVGVE